VKTTDGKTKSHRPGNRPVLIRAEGHRGVIAVKSAPSLKQALEEYFKETLAKKGCKKIKIVGNVLTVELKGRVSNYTALENYQQV
jgi:phage tail sheath protein FI